MDQVGWQLAEEELDREKGSFSRHVEHLGSASSGVGASGSFDTGPANFSQVFVDDAGNTVNAANPDLILRGDDQSFDCFGQKFSPSEWRYPVKDQGEQPNVLSWPQHQLCMGERIDPTRWNVLDTLASERSPDIGSAPGPFNTRYSCSTFADDAFPMSEPLQPLRPSMDEYDSSFVIGNEPAFLLFEGSEQSCHAHTSLNANLPGYPHITSDPTVPQVDLLERQSWIDQQAALPPYDRSIYANTTGFEPATSADLVPVTRVLEGIPSNRRRKHQSCVRCRVLKKKACP